MSRAITLAFILSLTVNEAQALDCQASKTGETSYWAWRLIDGRKCWYKGAPGMAKSLLHWPVGEQRQSETIVPIKIRQSQVLPEARAITSEVLRALPPRPTFEDRWRLVE
jgi:hypothetical protein